MGATVLEFHVVFDQQMFGPDAKASLTIEQTRTLVKGVREIESALSNPVRKNDTAGYADLKKMFGKSLAINKALKVGHRIELADLESKKPADQGISAAEFQKVIGKKITRELAAYSFLNYKDLE